MPFYEYECSACKFYVEALQKISEPPLRKCPSCKKQTLKKLISAPVFRLKGDGWYETDFKSDQEQKRNLAGGDEGEAKPSEPATDSGEAAKPAATQAAEGQSATAKSSATTTASAPSADKSRSKSKLLASGKRATAQAPAAARRPAAKAAKPAARPARAAKPSPKKKVVRKKTR
jgi:putative FmdB family regulatory protein